MSEFRNIEEKVIKRKILSSDRQTTASLDELWLLNENSNSPSSLDYKKASRLISELGSQICTLKETCENYAFRPVLSNLGILGLPVIFFKRVIRKLLKWYIEPICFQQTTFNTAVTNSIEHITELQLMLLASIGEQANISKQEENQTTQEST